jgi:hypothetical protein
MALESEVLDALRFGASPVTAIAECAGCDPDEVLDVLLDLERQSLVGRHPAPPGTPALRTWWELTIRGRARFTATRRA